MHAYQYPVIQDHISLQKFQQIAHYNLAKTNEVWTLFFSCLSPASLCFVHMSKLTWLDSDQFWSVCKSTEFTQVTEAWFGLENLNIQYVPFWEMLKWTETDLVLCCYLLLWLRSARWQAVKARHCCWHVADHCSHPA